MIISVASGKGGTGKTTVATNLAFSIHSNVELLDCDVEEPNAHLFIQPIINYTETITVPIPHIDENKCTHCGVCEDICQFKAIVSLGDTMITFPELCHSCGGCGLACPENAITEKTREIGIIEIGDRNGISFVHGRLRVGEAMSPPLIRKVREYRNPNNITIIDAPPGTSCPVIAAVKNTDFVLLVTEPTPFGLHDLKLAVEVIKQLNIPAGLVVNRSDIGDHRVFEYADQECLPILMRIPYDRKIAEIYSKGFLISEIMPIWKNHFLELYEKILTTIKNYSSV